MYLKTKRKKSMNLIKKILTLTAEFFKRYKTYIVVSAAVIALLAAAFFAGGPLKINRNRSHDKQSSSAVQVSVSENPTDADTSDGQDASDISTAQSGESETLQNSGSTQSDSSKQDKYKTDPVPEGKPKPQEPQETQITQKQYTCTFSITCTTILQNMDMCDEQKRELVPSDGVIFKTAKVTFYEGESVFDVLKRVCKENNIHMEFSFTPMYNSAYVEGINNLYEFDVGAKSGWMYSVNGWFPNYGCSRYVLLDGDTVEWKYTCDYGADIGGGYAVGEK